jgi:hypothetical protein
MIFKEIVEDQTIKSFLALFAENEWPTVCRLMILAGIKGVKGIQIIDGKIDKAQIEKPIAQMEVQGSSPQKSPKREGILKKADSPKQLPQKPIVMERGPGSRPRSSPAVAKLETKIYDYKDQMTAIK